jgi:TonB family protein
MTVPDPNDLVENTPVYSANGRFCVVVRWQEGIANFTSVQAGAFFHMDDPAPVEHEDPPPRKTVIGALYESGTKGRRLIAEIPLDVNQAGQVLVADSGRYLIVRGPQTRGCIRGMTGSDTLVSIYDSEGAQKGSLKIDDVFTPSDVLRLTWDPDVKLRHESQDQEVVVVSIPAPRLEGQEPRDEERRVDVATVALLDPKHDIYPAPRSYATPADYRWAGRVYVSPSTRCATAFADPGLVRIDSTRLFAQAVLGRAPEFPSVALKVRIRGVVRVEVVVSESGDVLCTRNTPFPFGLDRAAVEAARRWKFRPFIVSGHPVKAAGEILFHFEDLNEDAWQEVLRNSPPSGE